MTELASPRTRVVSDYSVLLKQIKEHNLLARTVPFYLTLFIIVTIIGALAWVAVFMIGDSWWNIVPAVILGICTAQYGFLAHEASHRQVFSSNKVNDWAGIFLADLFVGLGYGWWTHKHNKHHANPNKVGKDPDIDINVLSFTKESLAKKKGVEKILSKNQGRLFFVFLPFTGFDLLFESYKALLNPKHKVKHRVLELVLLTVRVFAPMAVAFALMNPLLAIAFTMVTMCTMGFFMGGAFAPNHKGMKLVPETMKLDFLRRQVLTSRNIKPGFVTDLFMGGLNYQIEHHLFPSMPRPHLLKAKKLTEKYCLENGIPYVETNIIKAYKEVVGYLNEVGLSKESIDPFVCPLAQYRYTT